MIYNLAFLLILVGSGLLSVFSATPVFGIPPVYVPFAGLVFGLAMLLIEGLLNKKIGGRDGRSNGLKAYFVFISCLGFYLAVISYTYFPIDSASLAAGSAVGGLILILPYKTNKYLSAGSYLVGVLLATVIGYVNSFFPETKTGWEQAMVFTPWLLFISWQVVMGFYLAYFIERKVKSSK